MKYRYLLFDFDHTLFDTDSSERAAFGKLMADVGVGDVEGTYPRYRSINQALWRAAELGEILPADIGLRRFTDFNAAIGVAADPAEMAVTFRRLLGEHGDWFLGVPEVLTALASRTRLGIVTNAVGEVQRARLARLVGASLFSPVIISTEVGAVKPSRDIFDAAFEAMNWPDLDHVLMIGDSLTGDIAGGANYGIDTCWFNPAGLSSTEDVVPTHTIRRHAELIDLTG